MKMAGFIKVCSQTRRTWTCAEVFLEQSLGYGIREVRFDSALVNLNPSTVAACFVYESQTREIDYIECSKMLTGASDICQNVLQPYTRPGNINRFTVPPVSQSTHRVVWTPDYAEFMSWKGIAHVPPDIESIISYWFYKGPDTPPATGFEKDRCNLWLVNG